jgi:hypothetical protein
MLKVGVLYAPTVEVNIIRAPGSGLDNDRVWLSLYTYICIHTAFLVKCIEVPVVPLTAREVAKAPCLRFV